MGLEALKQEIARLKQLHYNTEKLSKIGSYRINLESGKVEWTRGVYDIFELNHNTPIPGIEEYYKLVHTDDVTSVKKMFEGCVNDNKPFDLAYKILLKNGKIKYVHSKAEIVTDKHNNRILFGFFRDLTEHNLRENQITNLNSKMKLAFESGNMAWWEMILPSGQINFGANKAEMIGRKPEDFKHYKDFMDIVHPSDYEHTMLAMRNHLAGAKTLYETDYRIKNADNEYVWFRDTGKIVEKRHGSSRLLGVVANIDKLKKLEEQLIKSDTQNKLILESTSELIAYYDLDLNIIWINKAAAKSIGSQPEKLIGKKCYKIWHNSNKVCDGCPLMLTRQTKEPAQTEQQTPDGRFWHIRSFPVFDNNKQLIALAEFGMDITKKKTDEKKIKEAELKYRKLVECSPMGIAIMKYDIIQFTNNTFLDICGEKDLKALLQQSITKYIFDDDKAIINTYIEISKKSTAHYSKTFSLRFKGVNGAIRFVEATLSELIIDNEKLLQLLLHDITHLVNLKTKSKHVFTDALYLSRQMNSFSQLKQQLEQVIDYKKLDIHDFDPILKILNTEQNIEQLWAVFKKNFELIYDDFFKKLINRAPNLSQQELKHCAYIKINFETKEIASMFNVKPATVQMGRVRIKKKLKLPPEQELTHYILTL